MVAVGLMLASASVLFALGALHLLYTFYGTKLHLRDAALKARMAEVSPGITRRASMWGFWMGFNVSHSMAGMLFGLMYGYLAVAQPGLLFASPYLLVVGFAMLAGLLVVAKVFWFRAPAVGVAVALACYVAAVAAALA